MLSWTAGPEWKLYEADNAEGPWNLSESQSSPVGISKATVQSKGTQFFQLFKQQ